MAHKTEANHTSATTRDHNFAERPGIPVTLIPAHPQRSPACSGSAKPVENYRHSQGHSGAQPASHRAHLIPAENVAITPLRVPSCVCGASALSLFIWTNRITEVCAGLIVTR
ncbi:hypothetical protein WMY93_031301 [Mugilogobius chulae]|uniref:Uncharacterized protein n=1 Tax=Mugilogobius chulae TaxID=88201 RepID=A0AAW0MMS9_9GOBI